MVDFPAARKKHRLVAHLIFHTGFIRSKSLLEWQLARSRNRARLLISKRSVAVRVIPLCSKASSIA